MKNSIKSNLVNNCVVPIFTAQLTFTIMSNINFEIFDIPVEFKKINSEDFNSSLYFTTKEYISPNFETGYIYDELMPILQNDLGVKNTTVINAGVGQGKSKCIIDIVSYYANNEDFIIIFALPYNNLIEQYYYECKKIIHENKIFSFIDFDKSETNNDFVFGAINDEDGIRNSNTNQHKIHILTTNALLGNPGDDSLFQAHLKTSYLKKLQEYCRKKNKKIVIIFDEIHDSIHNFKEEFIINLWNFQGLIHKIFTLSATYNEASKEVIKYLSEFTERKIFIIESNRFTNEEKQSRLHIYFYSGTYIERDNQLFNLLKKCLNNPINLDMMVYSKTLIKTFLSKPNLSSKFKEVNQLLYKHKDIINRCYADIFDKTNANKKYDKSKLNIGTNFTTGVNIEKENHNYIVIFPKEVYIDYFNNKGVFTNGANSIIQALARQRKKGDIHVFLPYPESFCEDSLPLNNIQKESFINSINQLTNSSKECIKYSDINSQKEEVVQIYGSLYQNTIKARGFIENIERSGMNRLLFYSPEIFILSKVEKYLSKTFFGGNLSNYIIWAAYCNQFLNCKLNSINSSNRINLSSEKLEDEILGIYQNEIFEIDNFDYSNFDISMYQDLDIRNIKIADNLSEYELYEYFEEYFFKSHEVFVDNLRIGKEYSNKIKLILTNIIQNNFDFNKKQSYYKYLKSNIYYSNILNFDDVPDGFIDENSLAIIQLYKQWYDFVLILESIKELKRNKEVLPSKIPKEFKNLFASKNMMLNIEQLRKSDDFLSSDMFPFNDTFKRIRTVNKMAESFYKLLINVLYNGKLNSTTSNKIPVKRYVLEKLDFENSRLFNFLYNKLPEEIL